MACPTRTPYCVVTTSAGTAKSEKLLAANGGRRERRGWRSGLPQLHDPRPRGGGRDGTLEGLAAERIEDVRRLVEVAVELDGLVGTELAGSLEPVRVAPGRDDVPRPE